MELAPGSARGGGDVSCARGELASAGKGCIGLHCGAHRSARPRTIGVVLQTVARPYFVMACGASQEGMDKRPAFEDEIGGQHASTPSCMEPTHGRKRRPRSR